MRRKPKQQADPAAGIAPTPERIQQAEGAVERAEPERRGQGTRQFLDARGEPGAPWRVVDVLATMERLGSIDANERAAGERYRACYERAGHAGASAAKLIRIGGGDGGLEARIRAGQALAEAKRLLGGRGPLVAVCDAVLGEGQTLRAYDAACGRRKGRAAAMLVEALAILAAHWLDAGGRRC